MIKYSSNLESLGLVRWDLVLGDALDVVVGEGTLTNSGSSKWDSHFLSLNYSLLEFYLAICYVTFRSVLVDVFYKNISSNTERYKTKKSDSKLSTDFWKSSELEIFFNIFWFRPKSKNVNPCFSSSSSLSIRLTS